MKDRKINVDRPHLKADEILAGKNFDAVVRNHQFMSKPFYKQTWFFGTAGLASLGLIIGSTLAFQESTDESDLSEMMTDAPPNLTIPENVFLVSNARVNETIDEVSNKTIQINLKKDEPIEETFTLTNLEQSAPEKDVETPAENVNPIEKATNRVEQRLIAKTEENVETSTPSSNSFLDMSPRISNKLGGSITRNELLDNKGITTEGDVNVIHFELHLIDGLGGKVFEEEGNQLNEEMKDAIENVGQGETIYFENIRGKVKNGTEVKLNPLRYVLMN